MNFEIRFIRPRERDVADKLPAVTAFFVYGGKYVEKSMVFDPSVKDALAQQLFFAGLEAARAMQVVGQTWTPEDAKAAAELHVPQLTD
jgi:hypothetical protein